VLPADAPDKGVNWESNNPGAAAVDQNGKVSGIAAGNATITVRTADGGRTAKCEVTVETGFVKVESVSLSPAALTILKNGKGDLTATVSPDNAQYKAVKWMSSNPDIADVNQQGTVTGIAGGSAVITVSTENGGFQDTCELTVNVPVESVSLDHTEITVGNNNSTAQLTAAVLPADATNKNVTWASSNTNVATVDQNGTVTGKAAGNAAITVTTEDGDKAASCAVTVHGYFDVANPQAWDSARASISGTDGGTDGNPTVFIINITGNVSVLGTYDNSITGSYKEVRLTGGSGTLSLESNGSLIQPAANQTFIIDGPTLQGRDGNDRPLVYGIYGGSDVELRSGYIKGNKIGGNGGGVYIYNGTFTMTGGEISGNAVGTNYAGGGVYVTNGTFKMTGGEISGNTASSSGGGVYVYGNFEMTGGKISSNTVGATGGGVLVNINSTFKMTGGTISGNTAGAGGAGGGVFINGSGGTFEMTGGTISGNTAGAGGAGGGVFVSSNGDFTMTSGVIYGSEDSVSEQLRNNAPTGAAAFISGSGIATTITHYP
jgi:uncharacterized protein YjdB